MSLTKKTRWWQFSLKHLWKTRPPTSKFILTEYGSTWIPWSFPSQRCKSRSSELACSPQEPRLAKAAIVVGSSRPATLASSAWAWAMDTHVCMWAFPCPMSPRLENEKSKMILRSHPRIGFGIVWHVDNLKCKCEADKFFRLTIVRTALIARSPFKWPESECSDIKKWTPKQLHQHNPKAWASRSACFVVGCYLRGAQVVSQNRSVCCMIFLKIVNLNLFFQGCIDKWYIVSFQ